MKNKELSSFMKCLHDVWISKPLLLISTEVSGCLSGVIPFISVYLIGILVDSVYSKADRSVILKYAFIGAITYFILSSVKNCFQEYMNKNLEYAYELQNGPLSKKSMQIDYEYLEDSEIHGKREQITGYYTRFGVIGLVIDVMLHFTDCAFRIISALVIVIPKIVNGTMEKVNFLTHPVFILGFFALIAAVNVFNTKYLYKKSVEAEELYSKERRPLENRRKFYLELFSGAESQKDIRMCGQEELILDDIARMSEKDEKFRKKYLFLRVKRDAFSDILSTLSTLLVYIFSSLYGYFGIITIGSVISFAASIRKVTEALFDLSDVLAELKDVGMMSVKYVEFMSLGRRKFEGTIPIEKRRDNKFSVSFEHVSFKYPGSDEYVIKDLNLSFVIGEKLAIVGKNGSGKTTFIKLLCRLYDVTEGVIKVNGFDIRKYDYNEYCRLFSVVFQDFCIFDFGVGEGIACSREYDVFRVTDAAKRAGIWDRIASLPEGLDSYIGKGFEAGGVNFSGGEKQKLAIARAICKDAPFVIMDEPTAALDPEAETAVFAGFDRMVGKKTAIYISHRLASCRFCEDILVFDKGKVVQRGSHEQLEKEEGLYRELWNAQAKYYMG